MGARRPCLRAGCVADLQGTLVDLHTHVLRSKRSARARYEDSAQLGTKRASALVSVRRVPALQGSVSVRVAHPRMPHSRSHRICCMASHPQLDELREAVAGAVRLRHAAVVGLVAVSAKLEGDTATVEVAHEFVGGEPLAARLAVRREADADAALFVGQLLGGLAFLHSHDIVHGCLTVASVVIDAVVRRACVLMRQGRARISGLVVARRLVDLEHVLAHDAGPGRKGAGLRRR